MAAAHFTSATSITRPLSIGTLALADPLGSARMCLHGRKPIGPRAREAGGLADAVDRTFEDGRAELTCPQRRAAIVQLSRIALAE